MSEFQRTPQFKQPLSTGDFILAKRVESVNSCLEIWDAQSSWRAMHILFINLPDLVHRDIAPDFQEAKGKIDALYRTELRVPNTGWLKTAINQSGNINQQAMQIILTLHEKINMSMDKHSFRWPSKKQVPTAISDLSAIES